MVRLLKATSGNVIVNTSLSYCVAGAITCNPEFVKQEALAWIERIRGTGEAATTLGSDLERRVLHVVSAGNIDHPSEPADAALDSNWTAARLMGGITTAAGSPVPSPTNTVIVENAVGTGEDGVICLNGTSKRAGDLAAIGTDASSFAGARAAAGATSSSGTSMAAPQAAGLAAYVWSLDPMLTRSSSGDCCARPPLPRIPCRSGPIRPATWRTSRPRRCRAGW